MHVDVRDSECDYTFDSILHSCCACTRTIITRGSRELERENQSREMMDSFTPQVLLPLFVVSIITLLYWKLLSRSRSQPATAANTPPSPPNKYPIIGHLHLLTDMPHHTFAALADKLGPIFHLQLGQVPTVVISSSELAKLVLKTHDHVFASRPQLIADQYISFGCSDVTFASYGPYWRQVRKICVTELLSSKRVGSFQAVRDEEVKRLLTSVKSQCGSVTDMSKLFFTLANDILCLAAFGMRYVNEEGKKSNNLASVFTESQELLSGFCIGDFFPEWGWLSSLSGYTRRLRKNTQDLTVAIDEIISEHLFRKQATDDSGGSSLMDGDGDGDGDFIDVLLRVQQRDDLEVPITDDNLKALVLDMFMAGTDTTAATMEWTMTELARHPRVMKKAQEEVRRVASGSGEVNESHIQQLRYMKAVIKETMRLHPTVPLLVPRESMEKCVLEGYEIPAKTRILINSYAIGRDPKSWENPLEYIPERFDENNIDFKDQDFRFLPFGGGRRGCPGYNFGLATVETALARLLYHFDWALPPGVGADDVDLHEIFGLATRKKSPLLFLPIANKDREFK